MPIIKPPTAADTLRTIRKSLNLTQPAMASALGVSPRMYKYYELGEYVVPRSVWLACLALSRINDADTVMPERPPIYDLLNDILDTPKRIAK